MTQPASRAELFAHFDALGIYYSTVDHRPIFTVEEGADVKAAIPGGHTKNLFLKDKDGALFLVCALGDTPVRLNHLHKTLGCARLSFGSELLLMETLSLTPGSVTVFGLINDKARCVTLVFDDRLLASNPVNFHPLLNNATTAMSQTDLRTFVAAWGGRVFRCDFSGEIPLAQPLQLAM